MSERAVTENVKKGYFLMVDLKWFLLPFPSIIEVFYGEHVLFIFLENSSPFGAMNSLPVKYEIRGLLWSWGRGLGGAVSCSQRVGRAARPFRSLPLSLCWLRLSKGSHSWERLNSEWVVPHIIFSSEILRDFSFCPLRSLEKCIYRDDVQNIKTGQPCLSEVLAGAS